MFNCELRSSCRYAVLSFETPTPISVAIATQMPPLGSDWLGLWGVGVWNGSKLVIGVEMVIVVVDDK